MRKIYIAGPYTLGGKESNVKKAIYVGNTLLNLGFAPYIPHLTHYWDLLYPHDWERWIKLDLEFMEVCDGVYRIKGESKGSDIEVSRAMELNIPVFYNMEELTTHAWK